MTKTIDDIYELTEIKAIAEIAGDTTIQDALLVHLIKDEFKDGDCILYDYSLDNFSSAEEVTEALMTDYAQTYFYIDDNGIYHA